VEEAPELADGGATCGAGHVAARAGIICWPRTRRWCTPSQVAARAGIIRRRRRATCGAGASGVYVLAGVTGPWPRRPRPRRSGR